MPRWKSSVLAALVAALALVESSAQNVADGVYRVGSRIACMCGCAHTVATCDMFECSFSKPAKDKIGRMVKAGVSDRAIVDDFVRENGQQVYRAAPNAFGWIVPYATMLAGMGAIWLAVKRFRKPPVVAETARELPEQDLAKYNQQIEKDLSRLDS